MVISIPKKGNTKQCQIIRLIIQISKIMLKVIHNRLHTCPEELLVEVGFKAGRSRVKQIFNSQTNADIRMATGNPVPRKTAVNLRHEMQVQWLCTERGRYPRETPGTASSNSEAAQADLVWSCRLAPHTKNALHNTVEEGWRRSGQRKTRMGNVKEWTYWPPYVRPKKRALSAVAPS